ncbi:MAG: sigma-70 family RNA polymerase sigma factor [Aphanothece sp. CMT-3BRIN-NPC111]|jgi:RNA polymerase sigma factor (sigma-70 family)|nr:sigma-70 family RNA polymerase sigma factor [Aphanothece sp. CMT-3BRIN-NPC111]
MRPRQNITDLFSTFLQFEADRFGGWVTDPKLRRSMQNCLGQLPEAQTSENFWTLYWHKRWKAQQTNLAEAHLSAYLQESCYWAAQKTITRFASTQYKLSDFFQIAIAELPKILKVCDPDQRASLKSYSSVAFGNIIRDALRQKQEIDLCNDWALLLKISRKRLQQALQSAGLNAENMARYLLAWTCFEAGYVMSKSPGMRQLQRPDRATWEAIAKLYNSQRQTQLKPPGPECSPETLEKWLVYSAKQARSYLYPQVASLNAPKLGQESSELQDDLPDATNESLLAGLIAQEETEVRQSQQTQINSILTAALAQLDPQAKTLVELYYRQGLTQQQIAQQQQIPQYTVSRRLAKARESLLLALTRWSQETLHISPTSNVVKHISAVLEEWLQSYYSNPNQNSSEEVSE